MWIDQRNQPDHCEPSVEFLKSEPEEKSKCQQQREAKGRRQGAHRWEPKSKYLSCHMPGLGGMADRINQGKSASPRSSFRCDDWAPVARYAVVEK
jgi:hypothetical protein